MVRRDVARALEAMAAVSNLHRADASATAVWQTSSMKHSNLIPYITGRRVVVGYEAEENSGAIPASSCRLRQSQESHSLPHAGGLIWLWSLWFLCSRIHGRPAPTRSLSQCSATSSSACSSLSVLTCKSASRSRTTLSCPSRSCTRSPSLVRLISVFSPTR